MSKNDNEMRKITITTDVNKYAEGSTLISFGDTTVYCTASVENKVPIFRKNTGLGWLSAEYSMLPRANLNRKMRDSVRGKIDGRSLEIQRLIGRSLRSAVDFSILGERSIFIDCDVLQADGGTRTAAITGGFAALALSCKKLYLNGVLPAFPLKNMIAAVSVGILKDKKILDLSYEIDSNSDVDMNFVMNNDYKIIEIQGTAEGNPFSPEEMNELYTLAKKGCMEIFFEMEKVLGEDMKRLFAGEDIRKKIDTELCVKTYVKDELSKNDGKLDLVVSTGNLHKLSEIKKILKDMPFNILSMYDVGLYGSKIEETGDTYEENALIKAEFVCEKTGKITIADDSGLSVDVLAGAPGVHSARYAGEPCDDEKNNEKLLKNLADIPETMRGAKFISVIALVFPNGEKRLFKGVTYGNVGFQPKGDNGFGYDPLFIVKDKNKTYAEMSDEEKNTLSHRYRAMKNMMKYFKKINL